METPVVPDIAHHDRHRVRRAFNLSLGFVLLLVAMFTLQHSGWDWRPWSVAPLDSAGLLGLLGAPLLHGSIEHLAANAVALLILGTLAGSVYPKATLRGLPLLWLGSGLGAWLLGEAGSHHLGASGVTHGLMFLVLMLGLLRRDRAAIATGLIGVLFYGGMVMSIFPHEAGVSWQSHMGGAVGGVLAALLFRRADPMPPRKRYSWEDEDDAGQAEDALLDHELEQRAPPDVPVLWQPREGRDYEVVVPLRRRDPELPPRE